MENNIITVSPANYNIDPRGLGRIYFDCMLRNKNNIALVDGLTGNTFTYKKLLQRAVRTCIALQKADVKLDDRVIIYSCNHMDCTTAIIACLFSNLPVSYIEEKSPLNHVVAILDQIRPKVVFVSEHLLQTLIKALDQLSLTTKLVVIDSNETIYDSFESYMEPSDDEETFQPVNANSLHDTAIIFYTSGTTGLPKGICRSHLSLIYCHLNVMNSGFCWDVFLNFSIPLRSAYMNFLSVAIFLGKQFVIYPRFELKYAWECEKHKVTCMLISVWDVFGMCHYGGLKRTEFKYLKQMIIGGSVLSQSKMDLVKKVFPGVTLCNTYGQTETGVVFLVSPSGSKKFDRLGKRSECLGKGLPGITYKITDLQNEESLGPNQKGELRIKTVYTLGHLLKGDSSVMYDKDGWYKTGDLVYYDKDHYFYVVDRIKETIKYQYYVIFPSELEDVLMKHPAVEKAAVIGILSVEDGENPLGIVTLKKGFQNVKPIEIQKFVDDQVHHYQRLRGGVRIVDKFLMTTTGKIDRNALRQSFLKIKM